MLALLWWAIYMHLPSGFMNVSAGFACGWYGKVFMCRVPVVAENSPNALESKVGPLSVRCDFGCPKSVYMSWSALITGSAAVPRTIFAAGYLDMLSVTTSTCLLSGIGPKSQC